MSKFAPYAHIDNSTRERLGESKHPTVLALQHLENHARFIASAEVYDLSPEVLADLIEGKSVLQIAVTVVPSVKQPE